MTGPDVQVPTLCDHPGCFFSAVAVLLLRSGRRMSCVTHALPYLRAEWEVLA